MFEYRLDFKTILEDLDIPVLRELELSKRELDIEKRKAAKKMQQELQNNSNSMVSPSKVTNRGKVPR